MVQTFLFLSFIIHVLILLLMKRSSHSLNKIYADPHIQALANRINFIQKRRVKQLIEVERFHSPDKRQSNLSNPIFLSSYKNTSLRTDQETEVYNTKRERQENNCSKTLLTEMKTVRYRQCKQNSQRNMVVIRQNKQKEVNLKRIKRSKVLKSQEKGRARLQQFQKQKMRQLQLRSNDQWGEEQVQLKKIELKKKLIEQEDKVLNLFQEELAHKSVLIKKIENFLRSETDNI